MKNFKQRYNITSNGQLFVILTVFAITGSSAALVAKPILIFCGIYKMPTTTAVYYLLYSGIIFIIYPLHLLFFGRIFGQFHFFLNFTIKLLRTFRLAVFANFLQKFTK